jgi:hypothetical protein
MIEPAGGLNSLGCYRFAAEPSNQVTGLTEHISGNPQSKAIVNTKNLDIEIWIYNKHQQLLVN